jgi:transcriptional regulator with XRE-family HTH domain
MYIGEKLKEIRKEKRVTLLELSEKSGVQMATLSRIENHKMTGTLESHMQIAKALGIDLTQLYANVIRGTKRIDIGKDPAADIFVHSDKASFEILTTKASSKKMLPTLITVEPKGRTNNEQFKLGSERFIYVVEGTITILIDNEIFELGLGNSMYFDSSLEHRFENKGEVAAKILCVGSPADF